MEHGSSSLDQALELAKAGYCLIPVDPITHQPFVDDPHLEASSDGQIIRKWALNYPNAIFAVVGKKQPIEAMSFELIDAKSLPMRQWIYGSHLICKFVSVTLAPGGVGKSTLAIVESLAMVSEKALLGIQPKRKLRVWIWNGEDPPEELTRRILAAIKKYGLSNEDVEGLYVNSGRDDPLILVTQTHKEGIKVEHEAVEAIIKSIKAQKIDLMIVDPFVSSHRVFENDNNAIEVVAKTWCHIAHVTGCAIDLVHHTRKVGANDVTVEDGRGASALIAAARSVRVLNGMSQAEADKAGVERKRLHFRVDNGKSNLAPPPEGASWFQIESVRLENGDDVGVVAPWAWPNPLEGLSVKDLRAAQKAVSEGGPWRENIQANDWVGIPIANALGLDPKIKAHQTKIKGSLRIWIETGMFHIVEQKDENSRMMKKFVEVGMWAND
jgi:hypothetical protein